MKKITRDTKALVKDLEMQIDRLVGYTYMGTSWKQEYHVRKQYIEETLADPSTPSEIIEKILRIQQSLYELQNNITHEQVYLDESAREYKIERPIKVTYYSQTFQSVDEFEQFLNN